MLPNAPDMEDVFPFAEALWVKTRVTPKMGCPKWTHGHADPAVFWLNLDPCRGGPASVPLHWESRRVRGLHWPATTRSISPAGWPVRPWRPERRRPRNMNRGSVFQGDGWIAICARGPQAAQPSRAPLLKNLKSSLFLAGAIRTEKWLMTPRKTMPCWWLPLRGPLFLYSLRSKGLVGKSTGNAPKHPT